MEKLVRDLIPQIIAASGRIPRIRQARDAERIELLILKLREEVNEFDQDRNIEELADALEVLHALTREIGSSPVGLEIAREEKFHSRGGFSAGLVLVAIEAAGP